MQSVCAMFATKRAEQSSVQVYRRIACNMRLFNVSTRWIMAATSYDDVVEEAEISSFHAPDWNDNDDSLSSLVDLTCRVNDLNLIRHTITPLFFVHITKAILFNWFNRLLNTFLQNAQWYSKTEVWKLTTSRELIMANTFVRLTTESAVWSHLDSSPFMVN